MAQVTLQINGRSYDLACGDGEEDQVRRAGAFLDDQVRDLSKTLGNKANEQLLLVLAGVMLSHQLIDSREEVDRLKERPDPEAEVARLIDDVARRIDSLAVSASDA